MAIRNVIRRSMQQHDDLVVELTYLDSKGNRTRRVVSPIRFLGNNRFLGLCLSRQEPRQFYLQRCEQVQLRSAHEFVMPVEMTTLEVAAV